MWVKIIFYGVLIAVVMIVYGSIITLISVVIIPAVSNSTTDEIWKIFLYNLDPKNIIREFLWYLPVGVLTSAFANYLYSKRKLN